MCLIELASERSFWSTAGETLKIDFNLNSLSLSADLVGLVGRNGRSEINNNLTCAPAIIHH